MTKKAWYEAMFENYGRKYEQENFVQGTLGECDFLEREFGHNKALQILDVGCGTGRHSIELASRAYKMTGIDLSESMLRKARENAEKRSVKVDFRRHDARDLPFEGEFDTAIMMCEGGFPLMETDEMNYEILKQVSKSLKSTGAKFIFTTLNGLFPIFNSIEQFCASNTADETASYHENSFDIMTFRDHNITKAVDDDGNEFSLECNERYYIPSEITWLLKSLGWQKIEIFGAPLGKFSREHALSKDDFEMLVVAER